MHWTEERVKILKKLWSEGLSASQIADQLGGVSRNAVIGKVHRLKLEGRGRTRASPVQQKKTPLNAKPSALYVRAMAASISATTLQTKVDKVSEPKRDIVLPPVQNIMIPISRHLQLVELTERACKWPNGDPRSEDFHFCGNDAAETGPYCRYHARIAFQPASERRRSR